MKKNKGIWFYGLSGSGKTYASKYLKNKIKNSCIVDGDIVRKYISFDLDYSKKDRNVQLKRMLGISKILIGSEVFPIISTVWMNKMIFNNSIKMGIQVIKIESDLKNLIKTHQTYRNTKNVVGVNFKYNKNFKTKIIKNKKDKSFWNTLKKLI